MLCRFELSYDVRVALLRKLLQKIHSKAARYGRKISNGRAISITPMLCKHSSVIVTICIAVVVVVDSADNIGRIVVIVAVTASLVVLVVVGVVAAARAAAPAVVSDATGRPAGGARARSMANLRVRFLERGAITTQRSNRCALLIFISISFHRGSDQHCVADQLLLHRGAGPRYPSFSTIDQLELPSCAYQSQNTLAHIGGASFLPRWSSRINSRSAK